MIDLVAEPPCMPEQGIVGGVIDPVMPENGLVLGGIDPVMPENGLVLGGDIVAGVMERDEDRIGLGLDGFVEDADELQYRRDIGALVI